MHNDSKCRMESTVPRNSEWIESKLSVANTTTNGIGTNFISVKEEANFFYETSHLEEAATQDRSTEILIEETNDENNQVDSIRNIETTLASSDCEMTNEERENEGDFIKRIDSRCQIEIIDMNSEESSDYKFILTCEHQPTKFVVLRPLRSRDAKTIAGELFDIFSIIGAPRVLESANGRQLASEVVHELRSLWKDVVVVHGNIGDSSLDGKRDFKQLLDMWVVQNPGKTWDQGVRFIQIIQNTTLRFKSDKTPHESLFVEDFNNEPKISPSTKEIMKSIWCEEDWLKFKKNQNQVIRTNETLIAKLFDNDDSEKGMNSDSVSQNDEDPSIKAGPEFHKRSSRSSTNCENSSGFKFVNVTNESPLHATRLDDSQSETEAIATSPSKTRTRDKYQLKCKICQKRYMKLGHLKNHLKAHAKTNGHDCKICSKKFRLFTLYEKHMLQFHESCKNSTDVKLHIERNNEDNSKPNGLDAFELKSNNTKTLRNKQVKRLKKRSADKKLSKESRATRLNGAPLLECSYCEQKFEFPSVLKRHIRSHTNERPYVCQICNKSFKQLGHLSQHSLTHTDYRSFQCATCGIKFESLDSLKIHSQSHRGDAVSYRPKEVYRLFECDVCKKVFTTKSVLERHIFTHTHERQFGCKVCGKRFKQAGHVKSHMLVHTGEKKFECKVCSKKFSLSNSLKKHMYIHNGEKPYQCDVCGSRFLEKRNLNGHLLTHTNERPFACNICGKKYTLADTLRRHISAAHEDGRTYQCEICAKMFKQLAHLYVHKKVHTDERPYQCHLCEKNFKHKNVLKSHLAIHANLRPFECDVCKATFVRKTNLQTHIASAHMNERPYVCTICNKRFKQVSHLNGHVVVHSNSMPYQCDFCDRRCNRLDNLKKHMRLHTKSKE